MSNLTTLTFSGYRISGAQMKESPFSYDEITVTLRRNGRWVNVDSNKKCGWGWDTVENRWSFNRAPSVHAEINAQLEAAVRAL